MELRAIRVAVHRKNHERDALTAHCSEVVMLTFPSEPARYAGN